MNTDLADKARAIGLAVFDVDGVLTDGRLYLLPDGQELKVFHARDGLGLKQLMQAGVEVAIISGRSSEVVAQRARSLGIRHVHQGHEDKLPVFHEILDATGRAPDQAAFIGDDITDLPVVRAAGLGIAVADAHATLIAAADFVTTQPGGRGAAREVCDLLVAARTEID